MFLTHAPGADIESLPETGDVPQDSFVASFEAQRALKEEAEAAQRQRETKRQGAGRAPRSRPPIRQPLGPRPGERPQRGITGRLRAGAARLRDEAGRGGFQRVVSASRRSSARTRRIEPRDLSSAPAEPAGAAAAPRPAPRPELAGAGEPPSAASLAATQPPPSFFALLPGALVAPLLGLPRVVVHAILLGLALLLFELSPAIGFAACGIAFLELAAFRSRIIQDAGDGELRVRWPDAADLVAGGLPYGAAWIAFVPAIVLALVAGGSGAMDVAARGSLQGRLVRAVSPPEAALQAEGASLGHQTMLVLDALLARDPTRPESRSTDELAADLAADAVAVARSVSDVDSASLLGLGALVCLFFAVLLFPMTLLCAVRLRSIYGALHLPLILRSALRAPGGYTLAILLFLAQDLAILAALLLPAPLLRAQLGATAGHLTWVSLVALVTVGLGVVTASALGRFYYADQELLGWE